MTAHILMVEDDRGLATTRTEILRRALSRIEISVRHNEESIESLITEWASGTLRIPDAIILDGRLRWSDTQVSQPGRSQLNAGRRLIGKIRAVSGDVPIVAYSVDPRAYEGLVPDANTRILTKDDAPSVLSDALRSLLSANGHHLRQPRRPNWWGETQILRMSALAGAVVILVAAIATAAGWSAHAWRSITGSHGTQTFAYVVISGGNTAPIFGDPNAPNAVARYVPTGSQVSVRCRLRVNAVTWMKLADGGWVHADNVRPAVDETVAADQLPTCALR